MATKSTTAKITSPGHRLRVFGGTPRPHVTAAVGEVEIDGYPGRLFVWSAAQWCALLPWERPVWSAPLSDGSRFTLVPVRAAEGVSP